MISFSLQMEVGTRFESFTQFQEALEELKRNGSHPLQVYNSHSAEAHNKKRVSKKFLLSEWMLRS